MNNSHTKLKILDCTFRDGGYYNKWDFDTQLVQKYLLAIDKAGIDVVELGFRQLPQQKFLGAFAYSGDVYISSLAIDKKITVGVMIDAGHILNSPYGIVQTIDLLFQKKSQSRVDLVRIATHFEQLPKCQVIVTRLYELGYQVGLNLMQAHGKTTQVLSDSARLIDSWNKVSVLYFADSLGNMDNQDIIKTIKALRQSWAGELGVHTHNNKGIAVSNTMVALKNGISWIDGTICGMGRGAGNAQTENLLLELQSKKYQASALFNLVLSDFLPLKQIYGWGESLLYSLAANYNIHPTYIQEMLANQQYSSHDILQHITFLASAEATHYKTDLLLRLSGSIQNKGSWDASCWCTDKEILILGSGASLDSYQNAIIQYIQSYCPIVISLNMKPNFPSALIDVYAVSNETKMLAEFSNYGKLKKPLVIPKLLLQKVVDKNINVKELWDYGLNIEPNTFSINPLECTLPYELSLGYVLSLASIGGAKQVSLVGFDGYHKEDNRQQKVTELLTLYKKNSLSLPITSLTPTNNIVKQGSIYAQKI